MSERKKIRVGNASGYWGDDPDALRRQLVQGPMDYVTLDYLAEVTMSILRKQLSRNRDSGYAADFLDQMQTCLPIVKESAVRIITNAGGLNPQGCAEQLARMARELGIELKIGIVSGDDLHTRLNQLHKKGISLANLDTNEDFQTIHGRVQAANAYLGASPVIRALQEGAEVVITGRVADASLSVAPPVLEFGWRPDDWDRLASAAVAGHILECGAQSSGGNLTDWLEVPSFLNMGYPIVEFYPDASFHVTKHDNTGGLVNRQTVVSQLIYEIEDPRRYLTPDVIADFSSIALEDQGNDIVRVSGVCGEPPTDQLKVSVSYHAGYKAHGTMIVTRPGAAEKGRAMADMFWKRLGLEFEETCTELVGHSACHPHLSPPSDPPEVLVRLGVRDSERDKVEAFTRNFASLILNSVAGVAIVGSRPRVQDVVAFWPCLVPASEITPEVAILNEGKIFQVAWQAGPEESPRPAPRSGERAQESPAGRPSPVSQDPLTEVKLVELCYARSGDKGDTCNIGVIARSEKIYHWIRQHLMAAQVKDYFGEICQGKVERFEIPNLLALNFVLRRCLGGGGTVSLRLDPQGKTLADALLMMRIEIPENLLTAD